MRDAGAIIVGGGKGLRFGGPTRKQYLRLGGHSLLWWSIQAFESAPSVSSVVVVVPAEDIQSVAVMAMRFRKVAAVVAGGKERRDSVRHGLKALPASCRYVAVHDAVRPLVEQKTIEKSIEAARRYRAALAACPSRDTIKIANTKGFVHASPDRRLVWLAQTPQTFERKLLERAHAKGTHWLVTDDAQMVERLGVKVKIVESPVENIKVTHPSDFALAKLLLKRKQS